jgi:dienelactone hydrolase
MDPQVYLRKRMAETVPALAWKPGSMEAMEAWQKRLRSRLRGLLGGLSARRSPLEATIHEVREFPRYRRETVRFYSRPGFEVFGYFLTPKGEGGTTRRPAILCLPGHGEGVNSIVGIGPDGAQRDPGKPEGYQADFALQCAEHGYAAFAIEQMSFGYRRDAEAAKAGGGASSCTRDSMALLMFGETMTGWRVWDAMRALDYLTTRPEVDAKRLAIMGISGGGLTSFFTACLDTRLKAAVVSGYFNTFRDSILAVNHCVDNYAPGLLNVVEMPDMAGLVAPRVLFTESGAQDDIFPLPAFERAVTQAKTIYTAFGAPERFGSEVFPGDHHFHGKGAFAFLEQHL